MSDSWYWLRSVIRRRRPYAYEYRPNPLDFVYGECWTKRGLDKAFKRAQREHFNGWGYDLADREGM